MTTALIILALVNSLRAHPLLLVPDLTERAQVRADYLCAHHLFSHDGWINSFKNLPYTYAGENLAKGYPTAQAAERALVASPTHKANIINPHYLFLGVGYSKQCDIIVQLFSN